MVFENHRIDHIQCEKLPKGLDGETYILIFRKQQACLRHHYWQVFDRTGGLSEDPEIQMEQKEELQLVSDRKEEFQK